LKIEVPEDQSGEIRVVVKDEQGTREVYKGTHEAGDQIEKSFEVYPPGEFQIYFQGQLNKHYSVLMADRWQIKEGRM